MIVNASKSYVYAHLIDGTIIYIGSGNSSRAFDMLSRGEDWRELVLKNGGACEVIFLGEFYSRGEAYSLELELIKKHDPICNHKGSSKEKSKTLAKKIDEERKLGLGSSDRFISENLSAEVSMQVIPRTVLYSKYLLWCANNGVRHPQSRQVFRKILTLTLGVKEVRTGFKNTRAWAGVSLKEPVPA